MGKIATKTFCNSLKSGAFSGTNLNQCPTKAQIVAAGFEISGNYKDNQLVQEADISYVTWEYSFATTERLTLSASGETKDLIVVSRKYKIVNNESTGEYEELSWNFALQSGTSDFSFTKVDNKTLRIKALKNNTTNSTKKGQCVIKQNESQKTVTTNVTQNAGVLSYRYYLQYSDLVNLYDGKISQNVEITAWKQTQWNGTNYGNPTQTSLTSLSCTLSNSTYASAMVRGNSIDVTRVRKPTSQQILSCTAKAYIADKQYSIIIPVYVS
jgi:hypothetical protein